MNHTTLLQWLQTAPGFERIARLRTDYLDGQPGHAALAPKGVQTLQAKTDVLGDTRATLRETWQLTLTLPLISGDDAAAAAQQTFVQGLQPWVMRQSTQGLAPRFGNSDEPETLTAEDARLERLREDECAIYTMTLQATYTMIWRNEA